MAKRPKPRRVGAVSITVVRGPRLDGRWYWRARLGDLSVWTGWATPGEADTEVINAIAGGALETPEKETVATVKDLMETWHGESVDPRTDIGEGRKSTTLCHGKIIVRIIGGVLVSRVDVSTLETLRNRALGEGYAPGTVHQTLQTLRTAWRWGQDCGHCDPRRLPSVRVKVPPREVPDIAWEDFWAAVDRLAEPRARPEEDRLQDMLPPLPPWVRTAMTLIGMTGARPGEVGALLVGDLDLEGMDPAVWFGRHKGARKTGARRVILPPEALPIIRAAIPAGATPTTQLFPVTRQTAVSTLGRVLREMPWGDGLRFTPRDVRCLVTDTYYDHGADPTVEAKQLGHSPAVAMAHYRRVRDRQAARAVTAIGLGRRPVTGNVVDLEAARKRREEEG